MGPHKGSESDCRQLLLSRKFRYGVKAHQNVCISSCRHRHAVKISSKIPLSLAKVFTIFKRFNGMALFQIAYYVLYITRAILDLQSEL